MSFVLILSIVLAISVMAGLSHMNQRVLRLREVVSYIPRYASEAYETGLGLPRVTALLKLPGFIVLLVALHEDDRFFSHNGFNLPEIKRSFKTTLSKGVHKGGSSITQQLAKNVFSLKQHWFFRKPIEALYTVFLERHFAKNEIFALYLDNLRLHWDQKTGWSQAVKDYFDKNSSELSIAEALFLCNLIPSPSKRSSWICRQGITDCFPYTHIYGRLFDFIRYTVKTWSPLALNNVHSISFNDAASALSTYHSFRHDAFTEEEQAFFIQRVALEMDEMRKVAAGLFKPTT